MAGEPFGRDREPILAVVRAVASGGRTQFTTGPIRTVGEAQDSLDVPLFSDLRYGPVEIARLELLGVSGDTAAVELEATGSISGLSMGQANSFARRVSGPVTVVLDNGEWRVSDYFVNGRSRGASVRDFAIAGAVDGIEVRELAAFFVASSQLSVYLAATSSRTGPIKVAGMMLGYRSPLGRWSFLPAFSAVGELASGETRFEVQGWLPERMADRGVRVLIETDEGWLDVRPEGAKRVSRPPLLSRHPWLPHTLLVAALTVTVDIYTSASAAVVFLLLAIVGLRAPLVRWMRERLPRPAARNTRALIAIVVAAVALVASGAISALTKLDFAAWPSSTLGPIGALLAIGFVLEYAQRNQYRRMLPIFSRAPGAFKWLGVASSTAFGVAVAAIIIYTFPLPKSVAASEQATIGRTAIEAVSTGDLTQLLDDTYNPDRAQVRFEAKAMNEVASQSRLTPAGPPTPGRNTLTYILRPKHQPRGAAYALKLAFAQYDHKEVLWDIDIDPSH